MTSQAVRAATGSQGFTLLELSVALLLIAIVTGMGINAGVSVLATARQSATQQKMKAIEDALMQYRTSYDRLPCPASLSLPTTDANYGIEGATPGTCTITGTSFAAAGATNTTARGVEGTVPTVTLGLPNDFMYDGWGNRFRYAVDASMTANGAFSSLGLSCTSAGPITVNDVNGTARSTGSIYALISHGSNSHGAYTRSGVTVNAGSVNANEQTNCHCNNSGAATAYAPTYVQMNLTLDSTNALNAFDDLVSYKERWQMPVPWDTASCTYLYVADNGNNRVEKYSSSGIWLLTIPSSGCGVPSPACPASSSSGRFNQPISPAIDASGNVWVSDYQNCRVEKFDSSGNYLTQLGTCGSSDGQLTDPEGVTVDASGNIWVADASNHRLEKFNSSGVYQSQFGSFGWNNGQFGWLSQIAIDRTGNIWITDPENNRVQKFSSGGTWLQTIPSSGCGGSSLPACPASSSNGRLDYPNGIGVDALGNVWVADTLNERVQELTSGGTWIRSIGGPSTYTCGTSPAGSPPACASGGGNGQFDSPVSISFDTSGNLFVADNNNSRLQKFSASGAYLGQVGTYGTGNGQLDGPYYTAIGTNR